MRHFAHRRQSGLGPIPRNDRGQMTEAEDPAFDPSVILEAISAFLLGEEPNLRRADVAELSGVPPDVAQARWRALGFPEVGDDDVAFTHADVEALGAVQKLIGLGFISPDSEQAFIRTTGRTFARLAEWQARVMFSSLLQDRPDGASALDALEELVPVGESVQSYIWRRHLVGAAGRLLLSASRDTEAVPMCVGFADIVGYTSRSRQMSTSALAAMVERFEALANGLITDHHGQVIKTIGDEILFVTDEPADAAQIALKLLDAHLVVEDFPQLRIGMAYGNVLNRLGDVFGPVVNVASRLTSVARPGSSVIDRALADELGSDDGLRIRRMRRTSVKGYENLEPWSLKRPRDSDAPRPRLRESVEESVEDATAQVDEATRAARRGIDTAKERPRRDKRGGSGKSKRTTVNRTKEPSTADEPDDG